MNTCKPISNLVPRGNDFFIAAQLKYREQEGAQVVLKAFDFEECDTYDARIYNILSGETLGTLVGLKDGTTDTVVIDAKNVPLLMSVGVEVKGTINERAFRAAERGFVGIVDFNGEARVIFTPVTGGQEANLVMVMTFLPSAAVVGENAFQIWKEEPGNEDKTLSDFIYFLGHGESAYEIAVRYGYTGTEEEYNALYFDAVNAANNAAALANEKAGDANNAATAANNAADLVGQRINTIDEQMQHFCYHDVPGEEVEPAAFNPQSNTVWNIPQELSDEQKQQARANIGAAGIADIAGMQIVEHGTNDTGTDPSSSSTCYAIAPNKLHVWGEIPHLYLTLTPGEVGYVQEYNIQFTSGSTPTDFQFWEDSTLEWVNGVTPLDVAADATYQVSIMNGIGVIVSTSSNLSSSDL